jgi:hypothetical protein
MHSSDQHWLFRNDGDDEKWWVEGLHQDVRWMRERPRDEACKGKSIPYPARKTQRGNWNTEGNAALSLLDRKDTGDVTMPTAHKQSWSLATPRGTLE